MKKTIFQFAVLTGCLRIAKESIFTGLNNFKVYSVTDTAYDEFFGFTDQEVRDMLQTYGLDSDYQTVKAWYDGYSFANENIYCPWDVINYCADQVHDRQMKLQNYWLNTSGNTIVRRFVDKADLQTRNEIEQLIAGKTIRKEIRQELTYNELDTSIQNLWSVLFTTGYLTKEKQSENGLYELKIPNMEVLDLFIRQIQEWFRDTVSADKTGIVIELKYASQGKMNEACKTALEQIERNQYAEKLKEDGMKTILSYGIACYKKECVVRCKN